MKCDFVRLVCVIAAIGLASAAHAAQISSSMSWSSDSKWLAYTAVHEPRAEALRPGWLVGALESLEPREGHRASRKDLARRCVYRIWAVDQSGQSSVLIEESHVPLSAPSVARPDGLWCSAGSCRARAAWQEQARRVGWRW